MIPTCLKLEQRQIDKYNRFCEFLRTTIKIFHDEDSVMTSSIEFRISSSGLGDIIVAHAFGYKCNLMIDDDGELSSDIFDAEPVKKPRNKNQGKHFQSHN